MFYLLSAVEGETEKGLIDAFLKTQISQSPDRYGQIEVVPIPTKGNHGYTELVNVANQCVEDYLKNPENCYDSEKDYVEKWLVFDYDDLDKKDITLNELLEEAKKSGFRCVVSRPNMEFFILALLIGVDLASGIASSNYKQAINNSIDNLNKRDQLEKKGFTTALMIPHYDKRIYQCKNCLLAILSFHPELLEKTLLQDIIGKGEKYSEMPKLLNRIMKLSE